jgi:hypothetical protein
MALHPDHQEQHHSYATERHFVDAHTFIEIEFYRADAGHRVWPYIGQSWEDECYISLGMEHFVVAGSFEDQSAARDAALSAARKHLNTGWRDKLLMEAPWRKASCT